MMYFKDCNTIEEVKSMFKQLAKKLHPDCGGDSDSFVEMKRQYDVALVSVERKQTKQNMYNRIFTQQDQGDGIKVFWQSMYNMTTVQDLSSLRIMRKKCKDFYKVLISLGFKFNPNTRTYSDCNGFVLSEDFIQDQAKNGTLLEFERYIRYIVATSEVTK